MKSYPGVVANNCNTCVFGKHIGSHLIGGALLHRHLLLDLSLVADEVVLGQDLYAAGMVDWVVHDVDRKLTV